MTNGARYRMRTGETVEITSTRCFATPRGDALLHHVVVREGRPGLPAGTGYNLMPAEIERNGEPCPT